MSGLPVPGRGNGVSGDAATAAAAAVGQAGVSQAQGTGGGDGAGGGVEDKTAVAASLKAWVAQLRTVLLCRVWLLHLFTTYVFIFATATYWNFRPSYIEHQFRKSATDADYYAGLSSLLRGVVGCGVAGIAVVWIRRMARQIMSANVLFTFCAMGAYTGLVWIGCLKLHLQGRPMGANLSSCASVCACSDSCRCAAQTATPRSTRRASLGAPRRTPRSRPWYTRTAPVWVTRQPLPSQALMASALRLATTSSTTWLVEQCRGGLALSVSHPVIHQRRLLL